MSKDMDFLDKVYSAKSVAEIQAVYDGWAGTYDEENLSKGFRIPGIGAAYLARYLPRESQPILDAGCGTGLVGEALAVLGCRNITGLDVSERMLEVAQSRDIYTRLAAQDLGEPLEDPDDYYSAALCCGSFGPGHAPPRCLDELVRVVRPSGVVVFNVINETYEEQGFAAKMAELVEAGRWCELERSPAFQSYLLRVSERNSRIFVFRVAG